MGAAYGLLFLLGLVGVVLASVIPTERTIYALIAWELAQLAQNVEGLKELPVEFLDYIRALLKSELLELDAGGIRVTILLWLIFAMTAYASIGVLYLCLRDRQRGMDMGEVLDPVVFWLPDLLQGKLTGTRWRTSPADLCMGTLLGCC